MPSENTELQNTKTKSEFSVRTPFVFGYFLGVGLCPLERAEGRRVVLEVEGDLADRSVTMLGDDDIDDVLIRSIRLHTVLTIEEHDHVCVLLDRTGFAEVGKFRELVWAGFDRTGQLRERDDGDIELTGELLQSARNLGDLLDAVVAAA